MSTRSRTLLALLGLASLAAAQTNTLPEIPPVSPNPPPAVSQPATSSPLNRAPVALAGVTGTLSAPRTVSSPFRLTLTLKNALEAPVTLSLRRDNTQNCATAPLVRVLQVGTRAVIYPNAAAEPRLCAQDMQVKTIAAGGSVSYTRDLNLPPGEYLIEGWLTGLKGQQLSRVTAAPVRVTVK